MRDGGLKTMLRNKWEYYRKYHLLFLIIVLDGLSAGQVGSKFKTVCQKGMKE